MNVLSLFDGMSCGQQALDRLGIAVTTYAASEIEEAPISVCLDNYPDTVQLGDVRDISVDNLPFTKTDLLLAGSPCQGFSKIGKQLAFDDPRSALFFEFVRLWKETRPTYFLLENVVMKREWQDIISEILGVEPVKLNSNLVSAQNRPRLYWTNIPHVSEPKDRHLMARDVIDFSDQTPNSDKWHDWWARNEEMRIRKQFARVLNDADKAVCQTARQVRNWNGNLVRLESGKYRYANVAECEKLQTVEVGYTRAVSKTHAYKMLGNGWTVDMIAHLMHGLTLPDISDVL